MSVCYVTLSLSPSGLNLCQRVKIVHKTLDTVIFIPNICRKLGVVAGRTIACTSLNPYHPIPYLLPTADRRPPTAS